MKVAKLILLKDKHSEGEKQGLYDTKGVYKVKRERAIVPQSHIDATNADSETSGLMYVVDEAATKERDELIASRTEGKTAEQKEPIAPKKAEPKAPAAPAKKEPIKADNKADLEPLRAKYKELTQKDAPAIWGENALNKAIEKEEEKSK